MYYETNKTLDDALKPDLENRLSSIQSLLAEDRVVADELLEQGRHYASLVKQSMQKLGLEEICGYQIVEYTAHDVSFLGDTRSLLKQRKKIRRQAGFVNNISLLSKITAGEGDKRLYACLEEYKYATTMHVPKNYNYWTLSMTKDNPENQKMVLKFLESLPQVLNQLEIEAKAKVQNTLYVKKCFEDIKR